MSLQIHFSTKNFTKNFSDFFVVFSESFLGQFIKNDSLINPEAHIVLRNPEDREIVDNAVQEMKNNKKISNKTVTLSNNKRVTLSID